MHERLFPSLGDTQGTDAQAALAEADIIIGLDTTSGSEFTLFGTPSLESSASFKRPSAMRIVRVMVDCASGELEQLASLVRTLKRAHSLG